MALILSEQTDEAGHRVVRSSLRPGLRPQLVIPPGGPVGDELTGLVERLHADLTRVESERKAADDGSG